MSTQHSTIVSSGRVSGSSPPASDPSRDRIQARAFEIYQRRSSNSLQGDPVSDWLQAEREVRAQQVIPPGLDEVESLAQTRGERLLSDAE
ncbi:MAG: DUF2934 domain-containing protein [Phycisphaerales bacterium]